MLAVLQPEMKVSCSYREKAPFMLIVEVLSEQEEEPGSAKSAPAEGSPTERTGSHASAGPGTVSHQHWRGLQKAIAVHPKHAFSTNMPGSPQSSLHRAAAQASVKMAFYPGLSYLVV